MAHNDKRKTHDAEMTATIEDLKRENAVLRAKQENLVEATKALKENAILKADIENKRLEVEQLQRCKSDSTKDRSMSRMTGAQVVVNNSAIADLRETFSELNDNEWIETMEELSNTMPNEQDVIQLLSMIVCKYPADKHVTHADVRKQPVNPEKKDKPLKHLHNSKTNRREVKQDDTSTSTESDQRNRGEHLRDHTNVGVLIPEGYMMVKSMKYEQMQYDLNHQRENISGLTNRMRSDQFMDKINSTLSGLSGELSSSENMPKEVAKINKDYRKSLAVHVVNFLQKEFAKEAKKKTMTGKATEAYIERCVLVCWFMTVQDPKVVITMEAPKVFDEDRYKPYTKKGKHLDYLVWPVLHLHEGGPMIGKGVAQGKP